MWGTICNDILKNKTAEVICSELHLDGGIITKSNYFGPGTGKIWIDQLNCKGNEHFLLHCT